MVGCVIEDEIGFGQHKGKKYRIYSVMGRESVLSYWYVAMNDDTYNDIRVFDDTTTENVFDIRNLPNYHDLNGSDIIFRRKELVVPIIKEAIKKGYVEPV